MILRLIRIGFFILAVCGLLPAFQPAKLGGKWFTVFKIPNSKTGKTVTVKITLDLIPRGKTLTGTLTNYVGSREIKHDIKEGKVDGGNISFIEIAQAPTGEQTIEWYGALDGSSLQMTRALKGGRRKQPLTFRR